MKRLFFLFFCFLFFAANNLPAQEDAPANAEGLAVPDGAGTSEGSGIPEDAGIPENASGDNADAAVETEGAGISESAGTSEGVSGFDANTSYIEMDIKTSSLAELAAWCRELGLGEGGTREDIASRIRAYYGIGVPAAAAAAGRVITIESARTTEYFTIDLVDEEYARLRGDVIISLKDGNSVHRITAGEILYNRTRNVMTASGNVVYIKEDGDTTETFRGDSITVNLDNWSSIFMDGVSERSISGAATAYRFAGTVISRNSEEVTVLTDAEITNPRTEEAFWSLHASKVWLMPGNDFAILNAVLKVGNIPLLYFPFFYYPSDEIVFHPVLGSRTREGTYLQTTTYILGRPRTEAVTENSITRIFGGAAENMEKQREGVFLRSTGQRRISSDAVQLSLIFDAYVRLGVYLGTEFFLPRRGAFGDLTVSAGIGLTRNIYNYSGLTTPYHPSLGGESEWNSSKLFSLDVPFRYRFKINGSFQLPLGSFSWEFPYYSDPYVDRDFMRRSEILDWFSMLRDGITGTMEEETTESILSSYSWRLNGSLNVPVSGMQPYVNSFSISSISSSLEFTNRRSGDSLSGTYIPSGLSAHNPDYYFYFPNRFTMFSISASVSGVPYTSGSGEGETETGTDGTIGAPGDALLPDLPVPPWEEIEIQEGAAAAAQDIFSLVPPVLSQRFDLPSTGGPRFSFNYRFTPSTASELQFQSSQANWASQEDINWGEISNILTRLRGDGSIGLNVDHSGGGAYSMAFSLSGTGAWQDYTYMNEEAEEFDTDAEVQAAMNRAYNETYFTSSWGASLSLRPFFQSTVWGASSVQYDVRGLFAKTTVDTTAAEPLWDWVMGKWDDTDIGGHSLSANIAANIMDTAQSLSITAELPPMDSTVSATASIRAWISETSIRGQITNPWEDDRVIEPVYLTETLRFGTGGSFSQYLVYDPEREEYTTLTSSFSYSGLTASFSAAFSRPWILNPAFNMGGQLWIQDTEESLSPREFRIAYNKSFAKSNLWNNRLSFSVGINSSFSFDLQRYTNSRFSFGLNATLKITDFMDLTFSTTSENAVMYRYLQGVPFFEIPVDVYPGQETNFVKDLINSFRFDDDDMRRNSGFKLKSLSLTLSHFLGDWNARLTMRMTPHRPAGSTTFKFSNEITFLIQWVPIEEIKTQIEYSDERVSVR